MSFKYSQEVEDALKLLNLDYEILKIETSKNVWDKILGEFTNEKFYDYPLWDKIKPSKSVYYKFVWQLFYKILNGESVIVFFDDEQTMFLLQDGKVLTEVFENCYKLTFYLTDLQGSFVLAFNDHNYLIGAGRAVTWVENIKAGKYD